MPLRPSITGPPGFACAGLSAFLLVSSFHPPPTSSNIPSRVIPGFTPPTEPQGLLCLCLSALHAPRHWQWGGGGFCSWLHRICTQTHPQLSPAGLSSLTTPESRLDHLPPSQASLPVTSQVAKNTASRLQQGAGREVPPCPSFAYRFQSHHWLGGKGGPGWNLREREEDS